jgi:hypothetical protein
MTAVQAAIRASSLMLRSLHWIAAGESVCGGEGCGECGGDAPSVSAARARISASLLAPLPTICLTSGTIEVADILSAKRLIRNARVEDETGILKMKVMSSQRHRQNGCAGQEWECFTG